MLNNKTRFVIVGFDGLRPDCIAEDMPTLANFIEQSHHWTRYMAAFPTETYVNHPSIFSGFRPNMHGVIANAYYNRKMNSDKAIFVGSSVPSIEAHDSHTGLIEVPTLGDRLGQSGKTLRVICANSSGSTRLQHIHADRYAGHMNCCVHNIGLTLPISEREQLHTHWGNGVELKFPDFDGTKLVADIFLEYELVRGLGDVTILWIGEPDHSSHEFGIFAPQTRQARKNADEAFKRIFDWWKNEGKQQKIQLAVISDHGHGEVCAHFDLKTKLVENGWKVFTHKDISNGKSVDDCDIVMVGDYTLGLWLLHPDQNKLLRLRDDLMALEEVGMIFSQPKEHACPKDIEGRVPGTFSESLVFSDNPRGPDLRVIMRNNPKTGKLIMGASLGIGAGNHGGLSPVEIQSVLAIQGDCFLPDNLIHSEPASHDDFAHTVMSVMNLTDCTDALTPLPNSRVLTEALGDKENIDSEEEILSIQEGHFIQYLQRIHFGKHIYVSEGGRAGGCTIKQLNG